MIMQLESNINKQYQKSEENLNKLAQDHSNQIKLTKDEYFAT